MPNLILYWITKMEINKEQIVALKENKEVLYFYKLPCSLYHSGFEYVIVGNILKDAYDNVRYFKSEDWFARIESGSLLPLVCSTLNKSGKIKEYVNVYQKPDIIKLRLLIQRSVLNSTDILTPKEVIQESLWGIQVIKEFKVNRVDVFKTDINPTVAFQEFMKVSEPIYKMWKEKNE